MGSERGMLEIELSLNLPNGKESFGKAYLSTKRQGCTCFITIGEKIKRIRKFRKMTQKELAVQIGLGENGGHRMVQYESGFRVPKKDLVGKIAQALDINPLHY